MHNSFGDKFTIELWGASHAPQIGIRLGGVPRGIALCEADFAADIERRRPGKAGTTTRHESDVPHIVSGVSDGVTTGEVIEILFENNNVRSNDYEAFRNSPRPSHVEFVARAKYGEEFDLRGGGIFSGRMTLLIVAAGVVAKKMVPTLGFATEVVEIGGSRDKAQFADIVAAAQRDGDSVGGVVECRVQGVPVGVGEPYFDSVESIVAHLLFSVPAIKGVEFGSGFAGVALRGSERNDCFVDAEGHTATNNEGGINGGISNGNEIVVRAAVKPTASIARPQQTYSYASGKVEELRIGGRHDACIALRAGVVVEAAVAIALAELSMARF